MTQISPPIGHGISNVVASTAAVFAVAPELQAAFSKNEKGARFLKVSITNETYSLLSEVAVTTTAAADFDKLKSELDEKTPLFVLFKEKAWGEKPWVLIAYIPDAAPVQERMTYSTGIAGLKEALGDDQFSTVKRFAEPKEWSWENYKGFSSTNSPKPYSKLELAQQELDKAEHEARKERETTPKAASGFHTVSYPFTAEADSAVASLKSGSSNWIQLTLDDAEKNMTSKISKTVSAGQISSEVDPSNACFYVYKPDTGASYLLIYSCPESCPAKQRMVYSTSKSSTADKLKELGLSVKKLDIRAPSDLTSEAVRTAMSSSSAGMFKPSDSPGRSPVVGGGGYSSTGGRQFDSRQFDTSKPVFNRAGFGKPADDSSNANLPSKKPKTTASVPSALRVMTGGKAPPKGVVLPPEGAYQ